MQGHDCDLIRISLSFWHYIVTIEHLETQRDPARNYCGCRTRVAASRASKPSPYPISKIIDIPDFPKSRMESGWESTVIDSSDSREIAPAFGGHSQSHSLSKTVRKFLLRTEERTVGIGSSVGCGQKGIHSPKSKNPDFQR